MQYIIGLAGLIFLLVVPYALSKDRSKISLGIVFWGLGLQLVFAFLVLGIPALEIVGPLRGLFSGANTMVMAILDCTQEGSKFVFGELADPSKNGFIFAIGALMPIVFLSSLMGILYHFGVMQKVVRGIAWVMQKTMGTSGAESLSVAANVFIGQTEAPLVIRPYIKKMTESELFSVMTGGMATVAGGVMAAYVGLLRDRIPDIAGHLLTASVMSAPAALAVAKIIFPETENPETKGQIPKTSDSDRSHNFIEAAAKGAGDGMTLAINVAAMVLAFIALIAVVDGVLGVAGEMIGFAEWGRDWVPQQLQTAAPVQLSLSLILGWVFAPLAWLMGIPWAEAPIAGTLLGEKIALNEFVAYLHLSQTMDALSDRTVVILSYALCGFANFSSIAIQIGGIGGIAPSRKSDIARLGMKSVIGGSVAAFLTATIAGLLI